MTGYASLFAINVFTPTQWTKVNSESSPAAGTKINENAQYAFSYSEAQVLPTDLQTKISNIKQIISTFKFTK